MRPTPIAPTLIRLLGAFRPNTFAGTMEGKLNTTEVPNAVLAVLLRNSLRDCFPGFIILFLK
jgi:hypothetical protein